MTRLAGFTADDVIGKLRRAVLFLTAMPRAVTKSGGIPKPVPGPPFPDILATYPKEQYALSYARLG